MVILASVTHRRPDVPSLQPCTGDLTHSKSLVVLAMLRCNLLQMGTGLRRLGRDFVLAGYVAVVVLWVERSSSSQSPVVRRNTFEH